MICVAWRKKINTFPGVVRKPLLIQPMIEKSTSVSIFNTFNAGDVISRRAKVFEKYVLNFKRLLSWNTHRNKNMKASLESTLNADFEYALQNIVRCSFEKLAPIKHRVLTHDRRQI